MECAACLKPIVEQYALTVIERYFHDDCLKCVCCNGALAEMSRICYYRDFLLLCTQCYMRLYGRGGQCSRCAGKIAPMDYILNARSNVYHLDCFSCTECHERFCVGDTFYLCGVHIYCPDDYERKFKNRRRKQE